MKELFKYIGYLIIAIGWFFQVFLWFEDYNTHEGLYLIMAGLVFVFMGLVLEKLMNIEAHLKEIYPPQKKENEDESVSEFS